MLRFFENLVDPFCDYPPDDSPPQKVWPYLRDQCRPFYRTLSVYCGILIAVAGIELVMIYGIGWFVDVIQSTPEVISQNIPAALIVLIGFFLLIRPLIYGLDALLINQTLDVNIVALGRWRAYRQVIRQSVGWFESDFAGRISSRVMEAPKAAAQVVQMVFETLLYALAYTVGVFILLLQTDPRLAVPMVIWFVLYGFLMRWTIKRVTPASKAGSNARSELNGRVIDGFTNIHAVKMFAHDAAEVAYVQDGMNATRRAFYRLNRIETIMNIMLWVLNGMLVVGVTGGGIILWNMGQASVGMVVATTFLVLRIDHMSNWVIRNVGGLFKEIGVVAEGLESIAHPVTLVDAPGAKDLTISKAAITVRGLTHHYGRDSGGLDRLSLTIQPGEKIGLVGRSGAGKSTLFKLLLRFYDSESGQILIDGQDITAVTQDSLRAQIGMVQQDSSLLHRSLRDNIRYGRNAASEAEISAAAAQAQADEFIADLQDLEGRSGYDARVGERGVKLSGGQRQRIALARVILKDAPILLLDEATSALDSEVEAAIQDTLYGMMQGKTVIAIAHRLSTIAHMDRILVMDEGRIVEDGSHSDLLAQGGLYAGFWARQSGGFIDVEATE
ncbi:ATP-binding cassette domain-containing protein [Rhodobacteraceae bacterium Araon29]